jgi:ring-1,2-phenylacetyl-CoA epoxidase subunit PaaE
MTVTISRPARRRPEFHKLRVAALERLTDDACELAFEVPAELRRAFAFRPGQHVTVRRIAADGTDVRRSYSLCSTPDELALGGELRIGVKVLPGGAFSSYVDGELEVGDLVEVLPPLGHFTTAFDPGRARHYAAVVAGSGVTPVLSLLATGLAAEPRSRFTVVFGNRYARSVMFAERLADLKDRYPARLHLIHVLSREPGDAELLSGRLDPDRLRRLLEALVPPSTVDEWFLCGPYGVVTGAQGLLAELGVPPESVHAELFHVADPPKPAAPEPGTAGAGTSEITLRLDGRSTTFTMPRADRILDRAREIRGEVPYSCTGGVCSTCRARVLDGEVRMARNYALEPDELAAGYVLTCQSSPLTDRVTIDYDG